jgi:beta-galactosidase
VTFWARGERNIGGTLPLMILTNCDEVELRYGSHPGKRIGPDREAFPHLPHPPVVIDRRHLSEDELGLWGMEWLDATIVGYVDGKPAREVKFAADPVPVKLEIVADNDRIGRADPVRVMVRALDQAGNKLPFYPEPVSIEVSGAARLVGPELVPLRAGSTGFWVEATGAGPINIKVTNDRLGTAALELTAA